MARLNGCSWDFLYGLGNQSHYAYFKNIAYRDLRSLKPFLMSDQYFARQAENFDLIL